METDTLTVHKTEDQWMVTFKPGTDVKRLFGTSTIPTAFTSLTPAAVVVEKLRELNPGAVVQLA